MEEHSILENPGWPQLNLLPTSPSCFLSRFLFSSFPYPLFSVSKPS